jgi:hypothetical protein
MSGDEPAPDEQRVDLGSRVTHPNNFTLFALGSRVPTVHRIRPLTTHRSRAALVVLDHSHDTPANRRQYHVNRFCRADS